LPRFFIVGDAGEPAPHLDSGSQFALALKGSTNSLSIGFGYDEHSGQDGDGRGARSTPGVFKETFQASASALATAFRSSPSTETFTTG
jgi:hypothetical protein